VHGAGDAADGPAQRVQILPAPLRPVHLPPRSRHSRWRQKVRYLTKKTTVTDQLHNAAMKI
jgi:hypothetical protein